MSPEQQEHRNEPEQRKNASYGEGQAKTPDEAFQHRRPENSSVSTSREGSSTASVSISPATKAVAGATLPERRRSGRGAAESSDLTMGARSDRAANRPLSVVAICSDVSVERTTRVGAVLVPVDSVHRAWRVVVGEGDRFGIRFAAA